MSEPNPADAPLPTVDEKPASPGSVTAGHADTIAHAPERSSGDLPSIPGFEVRSVLGQGGMGVVYLAWQISLKRYVALKMILAGGQAGQEHLARFRTEAQAVAQLQHPNIVQIYEVGAHEGQPFVCLEYVEGGSLARKLNRQPQPAQECARVIEMLARAMHYTHQRGIVHRDLKPANILLQIADRRSQIEEPSEHPDSHQSAIANLQSAIPKITDFGLAKLQADAGQTVSGAVLGTPAYMAPEQAAGKTHDIGPLSDVYALGVILHEMLTGRPPFQGATHAETLLKVIHEEPIAPSKVQPGVPRDLETICLQALAKEPGRRYASALALAQDLERFGAGEPILARRDGPVRLLWGKLRRRPATYASLLILALAMFAGSFFAWSYSTVRQVRVITRAISEGLQEHDWSIEHLEKMEALVAELEPLAGEEAASARGNVHQRYADVLIESARHDAGPDGMARIDKARMEVLAPRDKAQAERVRQETKAQAIASLKKNLDARLPNAALSAAYLEETEQLIKAMQPLAPDLAFSARTELYRRFDELFQQDLRPDKTLTREDVVRLEDAAGLLQASHQELASKLRDALTRRMGQMQKIHSLEAPFANVGAVIKSRPVTKTPTHLLSHFAAADTERLLVLSDACQGQVQMEATFAHPSWGTARQLGLALNASVDERRSYSFVLTVPTVDSKIEAELKLAGKTSPATLGEARNAAGTVLMRIRRNGIVLRQDSLRARQLSAKPLTLRATREGTLLTLEVLQEGAVIGSANFQDLFATGSSESGFFALLWPGEVGLQALHLRRQTLPPDPGPLEKADHLRAEGDLTKALALFQEQADNGPNLEVRQEARCKQALCLLELKNVSEATQLLAPLVKEKGRWPLLATCQLWLIYLRDNKRVEADEICDALLAGGYRPDQLAAVISDDVRTAIRALVHEEFSPYNFLLKASAQRLRSMERMLALHDFLQHSDTERIYFRWRVVRAYRIVGQSVKARELLEHWVKNDPKLADTYEGMRLMFLEELGWLARELGEPERGLVYIDEHLKGVRERFPGTASRLLIERARLNVALKNWRQAELDLDEYFGAEKKAYNDFQAFAGACLLQGFLHRRRGDEEGAQRAWTRQYLTSDGKTEKAYSLTDPRIVSRAGTSVIQVFLVASLTDQLSDEDALQFQERLLVDFPPDYRTAINTLRFRLSAAVVRGMFRTPRGREAAERMAFQDGSLADYLSLPVLAAASSLLRKEGFVAGTVITPEHDELLWNLCEEIWQSIRAGKLEHGHLLQMGLTWKGTTNFLGWGGLSPSLAKQPSLRGPLAYVMGQRLLRLGQAPAQAVPLFRTALGDAPEGSPLRRLAEAELQRLQAK